MTLARREALRLYDLFIVHPVLGQILAPDQVKECAKILVDEKKRILVPGTGTYKFYETVESEIETL